MMQARQSERVRSRATGTCKTARGTQWDIQFDDLSLGGCRVDDPRHGMALGAVVKLFIAGTGPHHAEVAWRQGDRVGIEFLKPLAPRVLQLLAREEWEAARIADREESSRLPMRRVI
ncbi:PilZ domain-containing protein [Qipengyuania sp. ASV99]|uniref:PilZ domain-containing protein n=1 Tax=Qipengyuania sp. ASV99 TaxID=3399681 RepID=UPI003A4C7601